MAFRHGKSPRQRCAQKLAFLLFPAMYALVPEAQLFQ